MGLIIDQLSVLHRKQWEEIGDGRPFNYRYDLLRRMWEQNMVRCWGLFDGERMVGYVAGYVLIDMMTGERTAEDQGLYVLPEYRGRYGSALWRFGMKDLAREGIRCLGITCENGNIAGRMALKMGFKHIANRYVKVLHEPTATVSDGSDSGRLSLV
jgi:ribosomal protein S18 acetylase RimI-like enzyme